MSIEPDTKDWTWVLDRPCPECGFDAEAVAPETIADAVESSATLWRVVLTDPAASVRTDPGTWSPLEYACHVRDVNAIFAARVRLMLGERDPLFADWDQDATAVAQDYASQEAGTVADEVADRAAEVAATYRSVPREAWSRTGRRDNGVTFTIDSLARYHLHDLVHHAHDVSGVTKRLIVGAYDDHAEDYRDQARAMSSEVREEIDDLARSLGAGARVLEIGSGPGRDARALEEAGLSIRRTDISSGFVRLLEAAGHEAAVLDPLTDDLTDPARAGAPYDAVWASASLLHVRREDLPIVLARLAGSVREGGILVMALKEGDGDGFSMHGSVAAPRHFTYWREGALRSVLAGAGWDVLRVRRNAGLRGESWLNVAAVRR